MTLFFIIVAIYLILQVAVIVDFLFLDGSLFEVKSLEDLKQASLVMMVPLLNIVVVAILLKTKARY